jgi:hypothetical protein
MYHELAKVTHGALKHDDTGVEGGANYLDHRVMISHL